MFILIMHILFCPTNQKCVLQKGIKVWTFEVDILTGEFSSWLADWIIEDDFCQTLWVVPEFFVKEKGFGLFLQPNVLPKISKIAVTCPNSLKRTRCVNFDLYKGRTVTINFELLKVASLKIYISQAMEKLETSNLVIR